MTNTDDTPFISVDFMEITAQDTVLMHDPDTAQMVAYDTGYHLQEYHHAQEHPFAHGPEAILYIPNGCVSITIRDGSTEISLETTDEPLEDQIDQLSNCAATLDRKAYHPPIQQVEILIAMSTDRPPPNWPVTNQMSHSRTIGTDCGIQINHETTIRRDLDFESESEPATPSWDLIARSKIKCSTMPKREDLNTLIKATQTVALLNMLPHLHSKKSQHQPLPIPADQLGTFADVAAVELQYTAALTERYEQHRIPFGTVAAVMAIGPAIENTEAIREYLNQVEFEVPSLAKPAAERIDAAMDILNRESQPYDRSTNPDPTDEDLQVIIVVAHTIAMASKHHAIAHCAAQMENNRLPTRIRRTYRVIAEQIINASVDHLGATVGQLELENQLADDYPDLAGQLVDVIADTNQDTMTAFHRACQSMDHEPTSHGT